ncbi:MAG: chemotaxis protein CheD [Phycisphaerae bacterium]|jgi:chemotaxis protein CheD|nr:chemotaxis protein CheD [Phycisphaerae bacterium]
MIDTKIKQEMKRFISVSDMLISDDPSVLIVTCGLGSCLGVSAYDPVAKIGGLLHVMLPRSAMNPNKAKANPYMFVDTAFPGFIGELQAAGASIKRCKLKVAGGASVQGGIGDHFQIGLKNYIMLRKMFWQQGLLMAAEDIGGYMPRTMSLEIGSGRVWLCSEGVKREL